MIDDTFLLLIDLLSRKQQMLQIFFFCSRFFANTFFVSPTFDVGEGDKGG